METCIVPCAIQATTNDHLLLAEFSVAPQDLPILIAGIRGLQDAKLHCLMMKGSSRKVPVVAEGEQITADFGGHKLAFLTTDQLDEIEYFALDQMLELCRPNRSLSLRLDGAGDMGDMIVEMSVRVPH